MKAKSYKHYMIRKSATYNQQTSFSLWYFELQTCTKCTKNTWDIKLRIVWQLLGFKSERNMSSGDALYTLNELLGDIGEVSSNTDSGSTKIFCNMLQPCQTWLLPKQNLKHCQMSSDITIYWPLIKDIRNQVKMKFSQSTTYLTSFVD